MTTCLLASHLPIFGPMAKGLLERLGFEVVLATDGKDALAEFEQQIPEAVLITDGLPPFTTEQTIRAMREAEGGNVPKILVVVRLDSLDRIPQVRGAGANDCSAAPTMENLERMLRRNGLLKS